LRVVIELKLPTPHRPEGSLPTAAAILSQRQAIAAQAAKVLATLPRGSYRAPHRFLTVPFVAIEVTPSALDVLETLDAAVKQVWDDAIVRPTLADSVPLIGADQAWSAGYDGNGTTIAVLDTGVDSTHPFLAGKVVEEACYS